MELREVGTPEPCDLGGTRELTGTERVAGERTSLVIDMRYDDCAMSDSDGGTYAVDGTWRRTVPAAGDSGEGHFFAFDALGFTREGVEHTVDGALYSSQLDCSDGVKTHATLAIKPAGGGATLLLDDVVAELVGDTDTGDVTAFCYARPAPNSWSGEIAHGDLGRVEVRTPTPLRHVWAGSQGSTDIDPAAAAGDGSAPAIELIGAEGTGASLNVAASDLVADSGYSKMPMATLRVRAGDETVHEARDTVVALARGTMSDLRDTDADGLAGWLGARVRTRPDV